MSSSLKKGPAGNKKSILNVLINTKTIFNPKVYIYKFDFICCGWRLQVGNMGQVNYSASKAGVESLTRTAAKELSRWEETDRALRQFILNKGLNVVFIWLRSGTGSVVTACCLVSYRLQWRRKYRRKLSTRFIIYFHS